jgi:3-dehydroquinate dehydratase-2
VADDAKILILNGPNLNMLGVREPAIYGSDTLGDIEERCHAHAKGLSLDVDFRQTNIEGELVTWIQECRTTHQGVIINAAAFTHTSVALLDALSLLDTPIIEVHLSNIFARESFRHHSYVSPVAAGVICGFGWRGYTLALEAIKDILDKG